MTKEYWLQKKVLGGWSTVTYHTENELEMARRNYANLVAKGGYSYRFMTVEVTQCDMLEEVVEDKPEPKEEAAKANVWAGQSGGWDKPKDNSGGWGDITTRNQPWDAGKEAVAKEHGMTGKVWMINHGTKQRARVNESDVPMMEKNGYERGGPKTVFRG